MMSEVGAGSEGAKGPQKTFENNGLTRDRGSKDSEHANLSRC